MRILAFTRAHGILLLVNGFSCSGCYGVDFFSNDSFAGMVCSRENLGRQNFACWKGLDGWSLYLSGHLTYSSGVHCFPLISPFSAWQTVAAGDLNVNGIVNGGGE
jgi:hypothetical protein